MEDSHFLILRLATKLQESNSSTGKDKHVDQWNRINSPEIKPYTYSQLIFDTGAKTLQWGRMVFSTDDSGTTNHPQQNNEFGPISHAVFRTSKGIKDAKSEN